MSLAPFPSTPFPSPSYAHRYRMRDDQGQDLLDHGGIWNFELNTAAVQQVGTEQDRWLKCFNEAETIDDETLPEWMQNPCDEASHEHLEAKDAALAVVARLQALLNQSRDA